MTEGGNVDSKWGEKKMEVEDSVRTVECLRGRLLAERVASRNAKEEAEKLGNKLIELENLLKEESKSRNRAEKRLKFLMKKLESMNISYVSDDSEHSSSLDRSDISSVSSRASSSTKEPQGKTENPLIKVSTSGESQDSEKKEKSQEGSEFLQKNDSDNSSSSSFSPDNSTSEGSPCSVFGVNSQETKGEDGNTGVNVQNGAQDTVIEGSSIDAGEAHSTNSSLPKTTGDCADSMLDDSIIIKSCPEEGLNQENDQDPDNDHIDNSMALVPVDMPQIRNQIIDPEVLDTTVREVLDTLRRAKEQLQSSMDRRRMNMIRVG